MVAPRPRINSETGAPRPDKDGQAVFLVGVAVVKDDSSEAAVIDVAITSALIGIFPGVVVELDGLEATPWNFDGRSGLSWKAESIRAVDPSSVAPGSVPDASALKPGTAPGVRKGSSTGGSDA